MPLRKSLNDFPFYFVIVGLQNCFLVTVEENWNGKLNNFRSLDSSKSLSRKEEK
jgi:hypothetical protein